MKPSEVNKCWARAYNYWAKTGINMIVVLIRYPKLWRYVNYALLDELDDLIRHLMSIMAVRKNLNKLVVTISALQSSKAGG